MTFDLIFWNSLTAIIIYIHGDISMIASPSAITNLSLRDDKIANGIFHTRFQQNLFYDAYRNDTTLLMIHKFHSLNYYPCSIIDLNDK